LKVKIGFMQTGFLMTPTSSISISIYPIPAYTDNYIWMLEHSNGEAVVVDPGDANPVLRVLQEKNLRLSAIIITHYHKDHVDGIDDILRHFQLPVYGPHLSRIRQVTYPLVEGDIIQLFQTKSFQTKSFQTKSFQTKSFQITPLTLKVIEVPGHTKEHIAYIGENQQQPILFCGDTLFAAGCGRLFTGTAEQLCQSLNKLNELPENTAIYCTHEYTLANLRFANAVEPENNDIIARIKNEQCKRERGQPTLPTHLALERKTNPFLRYLEPNVSLSINQFWHNQWTEPQKLFAALRRWKDNF
jgi:hydroxyacylglutathione hydrolase